MVVKHSNYSFGSIILVRLWVSRIPKNQNVLPLAKPCCASKIERPLIKNSILLKNNDQAIFVRIKPWLSQ